MYQVTYHRATSIPEAVKLASEGEAKFVSGGMTLIPAMKSRLAAPSDLIDLRHLPELRGITITGNTVRIGAATPHVEVATHPELKKRLHALTHLAGHIGDPHVRHMGTMGGSISNNDPAADYPSALLALNATIATDRREIPASEFFTGLFETALEQGEMVKTVSFDIPEQAGYTKFPNPASRYAMAGVFVVRDKGEIRVAVTGAGDTGVFRSAKIEEALSGKFDPSALDGLTVPSDSLMSDMHGSAEYRAALIVVMAKRSVTAALA